VTFAVNGGRDQPFCGLMLNDRSVSHVLSGSYRPATGDTIQTIRRSLWIGRFYWQDIQSFAIKCHYLRYQIITDMKQQQFISFY
jgi:hypothetical protein